MSLKRIVSIFFTLSILLFSMCDDKSPTSSKPTDNPGNPSNPSNPSNPIDPSGLIGIWMAVRYDESWDLVEDGERDKGSDYETINSSTDFTVFDQQKIRYYYYDDEVGYDCYDFEEIPYSINGNNLIGEDLSEPDCSTSVTINGNTCYVTNTEILESGYYKIKVTMTRYTGTFPPASWPKSECDYSFKKSSGKHFIKRK